MGVGAAGVGVGAGSAGIAGAAAVVGVVAAAAAAAATKFRTSSAATPSNLTSSGECVCVDDELPPGICTSLGHCQLSMPLPPP